LVFCDALRRYFAGRGRPVTCNRKRRRGEVIIEVLTPEQDARLSELMRRAQQGDAAAYESLLKEAAALLRGFVGARLGPADAEDAVQETLLSIHKARATYDPARPFAPWMYAIARYRLADSARRGARRALRETPGDPELAGIDDDGRGLETRADLAAALARLPERQRSIIELLKLEGLSVGEVARRLGMSESAVKVSAHRGYKVLRRLLEAGTDD
jgi:RNA polymerase sigma-70 factor (ECF subfamily)